MKAGDLTRAPLREAVPVALGFLLAILTQLPFGDGSGNVPVPHVSLMLVFYWTIHRPECVPMPAVAALGLFQDLLWGGPVGLSMLVLLGVRVALADQQPVFARQSFLVGWAAFLPVLVLAMAASYVIAALYYLSPPRPGPLLAHMAATFAAYPLAGWLFGRIEHMLWRR
ncbi:MAG: rod shape-determining protein MreD [Rhodothalassiaceae bacterium]